MDLDEKSADEISGQSENALHFSQVDISRLYGIDLGLQVDKLCKGINIVYGANASGKTTLARAIRALIWPKTVEGDMPIVSGRFTLKDTIWNVVLEGQKPRYQKGGRSANPPAFPPSSHQSRYHLYLADLLLATSEDDSFARRVIQEAQGGIDVQAVAQELSFEVPTLRKTKTANEVERLRGKVRKAKKTHEGIRGEERSLDGLRRKRVEAQKAAKRADALEQAIEVSKTRNKHEKAEAELKRFPAAIAQVRGNEVETLEELRSRMSDAKADIDSADKDIEEAEVVLSESVIPEGGLPKGRIEKIRENVSKLNEAERKVEDLKVDLKKAREKENAAWKRLSAGTDKETAAAISLPDVERVETHVEAVEQIQGQRDALSTLENLLKVETSGESADTLRDGLRLLTRWLQESQDPSEGRTALWPNLIMGIAILVGVTGMVTAIIASSVVSWLGGALVVCAVLLIIGGWQVRVSEDTDRSNGGAAYREEFERTGVEEPAAWTRGSVEQHVDDLAKRFREAVVATEKQSEWKRTKPELDKLEKNKEALDEERERLVKEIGLEPDTSSRSLAWLLDRLSQWQSAHNDVEAITSSLNEAQGNAKKRIDALNSLLTPYNLDGIEDSSDAKENLVVLESERDDYRKATDHRESAREKKRRAKRNQQQAEKKKEVLYERLNLEIGEENKLRALTEKKEAYDEAIDHEQKLKIELDVKRRRLQSLKEYGDWMEVVAREKLERRFEEANDEAEQEERYTNEIKEIESNIKSAQERGTLEQYRAEYRAKRDQLLRDRHRHYEKAAGAALADFVQDKTQDQDLPLVYERARDLFAEITKSRYELKLDRSSPSFYAFDHVEERGFALDELSSGTKVQLLLSVRVSFVEHQEQGVKLPLVLDETLANSDEGRAQAIIEAIQRIAQTGRQVFYLTAQQDEVNKWDKTQIEEEIPYQIVSLSEMDAVSIPTRNGDGHTVPAQSPLPNISEDASPTHEELRELLDFQEWSPRGPVSTVHLWYLIYDPDLLLTLIREGIITWGQLKFQHRRGGLSATEMNEMTFQHVQSLARAIKSWKEAWQIGRGEPVDRTVLQDSGAITENYIDRVSDLANDLDGDAAALLRALREREDKRAERFHSSKADELEAYLEKEGYLNRQETKDAEEMWQFVIADLAQEREGGVIDRDDLKRLFKYLEAS